MSEETKRPAWTALELRELLRRGQAFQQPSDKPSWAEQADTFTEPALRAWLRICVFSVSTLGVCVLVMLIFWPKSVSTIIRLIELIISSGRGFAIPALVLVTLLPRLLRFFAGRREQPGPESLVEPPSP